MEQSGVEILNRNEMVNEPFASDLMRIYNLDIGRAGRVCALFELARRELRLGEVRTQRADVIYKKGRSRYVDGLFKI